MYLRAVLFLLLLDFNNAGSYSSMLPECEYSSVSTPWLMGLEEEGLCDTNSTITCCLRPILHLSRKTGVTVTDHVRCRFRQISIKDGGYTVTGPVSEIPGTVVACDQVTCIVPDGQIPVLAGLVFPGWLISVTTDGTGYSNEKIYLPYDGRCLDCVWVGVAKSCTLRENYCYISGQCIARGAQNPEEDCQICDPDKSLLQYSGGNACVFGGKCVPYGVQHPTDSCRVCDRDQKDFVMRTDVCVEGDGTCVNVGEQDPDTTCRTCAAGTFEYAPKDGTCYIGSTCFDNTMVNPENNCEQCNSGASQTAFTQRADVCVAGDGTCVNAGEQDPDSTCRTCSAETFQFETKDNVCVFEGQCVPDGDQHPTDRCRVCDGGQGQFVAGDDVCVARDGTCVKAGEPDPGAACRLCADGAFQFETQVGFCLAGETCIADGEDDPTSPCRVCDGAKRSFVPKQNVCVFEGQCVSEGDRLPTDTCRVCDGDQGQFVTRENVCVFEGKCVSDGDRHPTDTCRVCDGDQGQFVTRADVCIINGACFAADERNPNNNCEECRLSAPRQWTQITVSAVGGTLTCESACKYFRDYATNNFDYICIYVLRDSVIAQICQLTDITDLNHLQCPKVDISRAFAVCRHSTITELQADPIACPRN